VRLDEHIQNSVGLRQTVFHFTAARCLHTETFNETQFAHTVIVNSPTFVTVYEADL